MPLDKHPKNKKFTPPSLLKGCYAVLYRYNTVHVCPGIGTDNFIHTISHSCNLFSTKAGFQNPYHLYQLAMVRLHVQDLVAQTHPSAISVEPSKAELTNSRTAARQQLMCGITIIKGSPKIAFKFAASLELTIPVLKCSVLPQLKCKSLSNTLSGK